MKLIYAVIHGESYAVRSEKGGLGMLKTGYSVDPGYGFESPQRDNEWIRDH